jgi:hypothetical protein
LGRAGDVGYSATIQLGTPPQDYLLIMDSGSADLWVGSESCTSLQGGDCGPHQFLGTNSSSTFVDSQQPWNIQYGTGSVAGTKVTDNLAVAGMALNAHPFGVAAQESVDFSAASVVFDGIMGLAQSVSPMHLECFLIKGLKNKNVVDAVRTRRPHAH